MLFKANYLKRHGSYEYILEPDRGRGAIDLMSIGTSRYWEVEVTGRYVGDERRDLTVSYVRSRGEADLNNYDQFYGNLRNPILRPNEHDLVCGPTGQAHDERHEQLTMGPRRLAPGQHHGAVRLERSGDRIIDQQCRGSRAQPFC